eukprot:708168-Amphidinium_carterae.2
MYRQHEQYQNLLMMQEDFDVGSDLHDPVRRLEALHAAVILLRDVHRFYAAVPPDEDSLMNPARIMAFHLLAGPNQSRNAQGRYLGEAQARDIICSKVAIHFQLRRKRLGIDVYVAFEPQQECSLDYTVPGRPSTTTLCA